MNACLSCAKGLSGIDKQYTECLRMHPSLNNIQKTEHTSQPNTNFKNKIVISIPGVVVFVLIVLFKIGVFGFSVVENRAAELNNTALESVQSDDTTITIDSLKKAVDTSTIPSHKVDVLKNLAYLYISKGKQMKC